MCERSFAAFTESNLLCGQPFWRKHSIIHSLCLGGMGGTWCLLISFLESFEVDHMTISSFLCHNSGERT